MSDFFGRMSWLITVRPWITITFLIVLTVVIGAGAQLRAPPTEGASVAFLPPGHPVANATFEIDEFFGESGEISVVTVLFRGEVLTPEGLSQMDDLLNDMVSDPSVSELLVPTDAVVAPSTIVRPFAQALGEESITPAVIEAARDVPEIQFALDALTGTDTDGKPVGIANIRLIDTGDDRLKDVERRINELATGNEGLLRVSSLSPAIVEDEYKQATESGMGPLIGIALLLIALLLLLFTRTLSDMLLTLTGLIFSIVWVVGAEGWLGPNGLSLIGPPSSLTAMVPVIIISLTVDYAIQVVSHYREQRIEGESVVPAVRKGLRHVTIPLTLAAVTTIVSLLATLFLADKRDRRLRHRRRFGRGHEPDRDADIDSGRADNHRPSA